MTRCWTSVLELPLARCPRLGAAPAAVVPPKSSGSYRASGGGLQGCPPRGASVRAAGAAAVVLERLTDRGAGGGSVSPPPRRQVFLVEGGCLPWRRTGPTTKCPAAVEAGGMPAGAAAPARTTRPPRPTASIVRRVLTVLPARESFLRGSPGGDSASLTVAVNRRRRSMSPRAPERG